MFDWIINNIGTIAVCTVLLAIVTAITIYLIRNKKAGKNSCSCGCGCTHCAMKDSCHAGKDTK
ncbi:MAG: FeoB-associated Cys-rich membrane protein [Ruminococcaceae bacterium]|nr:FeoB-associated Cys-rich membrane protein [Oscillospiraceae bacterium]